MSICMIRGMSTESCSQGVETSFGLLDAPLRQPGFEIERRCSAIVTRWPGCERAETI